ncbi:Solute carrier family 35 member G1 [Linum perenne]
MAASAEISDGDGAVELIVCDVPASASTDSKGDAAGDADDSVTEEVAPLLKQPAERPKINIFSISYSRRKPRERAIKLPESDAQVSQLILWLWGGSRYSGMLCVALSSSIYFSMEVLSDVFSAQSIPLFETAFARCTVLLVLSYLWLRRTGQPMFGPSHARKLLISRALMGYLSLLSFIYCVQRLPLSQAIVLSFTTPIMASIAARIAFHEKLKFGDVGGLLCNFFGVLFIFRQSFTAQGEPLGDDSESNTGLNGIHYLYAILAGLLSSITGGICYCLIRAGSKACDQPVTTVFSFGILAAPVSLVCMFIFDDVVLPEMSSLILMLLLGGLAFLAEVFLARGLQLEKTIKAANFQYFEAALTELWGIASSTIAASFGGLIGCILILASIGCTIYVGPDKEVE